MEHDLGVPTSRAAPPGGRGGTVDGLGSAIRRERHRLRLTLVQVAERANISPAFLSLVERQKATPSLGSLAGIADALGLPVAAFLHVGPPADAVTRAAERPRFTFGTSNVTYERLSTVFPGQQLDAVAIHVPPGHEAEAVSHTGEEWIYVVSGRLRVLLRGETIDLGTGDTCHFRGETVHSYANKGQAATTLLWVGTVPVFRNAQSGFRDIKQAP